MKTMIVLGLAIAGIGSMLACSSEGTSEAAAKAGSAGSVAASGGSGGQTGGAAGESGAAGSTSSGGSGAGSGGSPSFEGLTRVDSGSPDAIAGSAHVAIAPDGTFYVTWASESAGVMLARSTDGGKSFGAALSVSSAKPLVSMARLPYVVATDARIAVAFNDPDGTIYLHTADAGASPAFGSATLIGKDVPTSFRDFPKPVFLGDGSLGVAWHGYPDTGARIFFSRENDGFASKPASGGAPGVPCECCPLDVTLTAGGDLVLAFRNNDDNTREMWSARAPNAGAFAGWTQLSTSEGYVPACPMMGPRLARDGDRLIAAWSSRGSKTAGVVHLASSTDAGATWTSSQAAGNFQADEPTIAVGAPSTIFVAGVTGNGSSALIQSDDGGQTWSSPEPLAAPDGALEVPQAQSTSGIAALAAVSSARSVWLRRMQ